MSLHKAVGAVDVHIAYAFTYASAALRTGATGFTSADLGKIAWQTDDNTFWALVATTPTWVELTSTSPTPGTGSILVWGANSIASTVDSRRLPPGFYDGLATTASPRGFLASRAGTMQNLQARHNTANGNGQPVVYTLWKNGVATALAVSLATGAIGGAEDVTDTVVVARGDLIEIVASKAASIASGVLDSMVSVEMT